MLLSSSGFPAQWAASFHFSPESQCCSSSSCCSLLPFREQIICVFSAPCPHCSADGGGLSWHSKLLAGWLKHSVSCQAALTSATVLRSPDSVLKETGSQTKVNHKSKCFDLQGALFQHNTILTISNTDKWLKLHNRCSKLKQITYDLQRSWKFALGHAHLAIQYIVQFFFGLQWVCRVVADVYPISLQV